MIVTDNNKLIADENFSSKVSYHTRLVVRPSLGGTQRCIMGEDVTLDDLKSPSKNKLGKLCDGRNIINLGKAALADVKVLTAMTTSWMRNDVMPSGKSWDDLIFILKMSGW